MAKWTTRQNNKCACVFYMYLYSTSFNSMCIHVCHMSACIFTSTALYMSDNINICFSWLKRQRPERKRD